MYGFVPRIRYGPLEPAGLTRCPSMVSMYCVKWCDRVVAVDCSFKKRRRFRISVCTYCYVCAGPVLHPRVQALVREMGVTAFRYPAGRDRSVRSWVSREECHAWKFSLFCLCTAGTFADFFDWRNAIGPLSSRQETGRADEVELHVLPFVFMATNMSRICP